MKINMTKILGALLSVLLSIACVGLSSPVNAQGTPMAPGYIWGNNQAIQLPPRSASPLTFGLSKSAVEFGIVCDGATNNTTAFAKIKTFLNATPSGATISFPPGICLTSSWDMSSTSNWVIQGQSGENTNTLGNTIGTYITCTASGSGACVDFTDTKGISLNNISVSYNNAGFTGTVIAMPSSGGFSTRNQNVFNNVQIISSPAGSLTSASIGIYVKNSVQLTFNNVSFQSMLYGIAGAFSAASNADTPNLSCNGCVFIGMANGGAAVLNPGDGWSFRDSWFFQHTDLTPSGIIWDGTNISRSMTLSGNRFSDASGAGAWIDAPNGITALEVSGGYFSGGASTAFIDFHNGTVSGLSVHGMWGAFAGNFIKFGASATCTGAAVTGNDLSTITSTKIVNQSRCDVWSVFDGNSPNIASARPVTTGGTGLTSGTSGGVPYFSSTSAIASSTALTAFGVVYGGGIGGAPVATAAGATGQILLGNTGSAPTWGAATGVAVTTFSAGTTGFTPNSATAGAVTLAGTLIAANGGTGFASYAVGDLLTADTTSTLSRLADVATGNVVLSGGVAGLPVYGKVGLTTHVTGTLAVGNGGTGLTTGDGIPYFSGSGTTMTATGSLTAFGALYGGGSHGAPAVTAAGAANTVLHGNGAAPPSFAAVANADLVNSATTVNGQTCTLGSTCTITLAAAGVTVGTSIITGGTSTRILYDNAGVLGEYTLTGSGTVAVMQTSPSLITPALGVATATSLVIGAGSAITSSGAGGALGTNAFTSTAYAPLASPTFTGTVTLPAVTLGGTIAGGGNQINNVIIGTTTPLAGAFTTLTASTSVTVKANSTTALVLNTPGATQAVGITMQDNGTNEWTFYKDTNQNLVWQDDANGNVAALYFVPGAATAGHINIGYTTDAASSAGGAFQIAGGASVAKRFWLPAITASAGLQTAVLCQSSGGEVIADSVACLASSEDAKLIFGQSDLGLRTVMALGTIDYQYKDTGNSRFDDAPNHRMLRAGFRAEDAARVDKRLVALDANGKVRTIVPDSFIAALWNGMQELKADNDNLRAELQQIKVRN